MSTCMQNPLSVTSVDRALIYNLTEIEDEQFRCRRFAVNQSKNRRYLTSAITTRQTIT